MRCSPLFLIILCSVLGWNTSNAQTGHFDFGAELQLYPTGIIPGIRLAKSWNGSDEFHLRLGYQMIDHRDLGKHQDESGTGYGFTLGYRRYVKEQAKRWALGLRSDIWFNTIDWYGSEQSGPMESGQTKITVLQPTIEATYLIELGKADWNVAPSVSFGYEVNIKTEGEPTGEGAILLIGVTLSRRI